MIPPRLPHGVMSGVPLLHSRASIKRSLDCPRDGFIFLRTWNKATGVSLLVAKGDRPFLSGFFCMDGCERLVPPGVSILSILLWFLQQNQFCAIARCHVCMWNTGARDPSFDGFLRFLITSPITSFFFFIYFLQKCWTNQQRASSEPIRLTRYCLLFVSVAVKLRFWHLHTFILTTYYK